MRPVPRTPLQVLGSHGCGQPVRAHCEAAVGARRCAGGVHYGTGGCARGWQLDGGDAAGLRGQGGDIPGGVCGNSLHRAWALSGWSPACGAHNQSWGGAAAPEWDGRDSLRPLRLTRYPFTRRSPTPSLTTGQESALSVSSTEGRTRSTGRAGSGPG